MATKVLREFRRHKITPEEWRHKTRLTRKGPTVRQQAEKLERDAKALRQRIAPGS